MNRLIVIIVIQQSTVSVQPCEQLNYIHCSKMQPYIAKKLCLINFWLAVSHIASTWSTHTVEEIEYEIYIVDIVIVNKNCSNCSRVS